MADPRQVPADPPAPPPNLANLFGLLPQWLTDRMQGDPAVNARNEAMQRQAEADSEKQRQQLYARIAELTPEPVKRVARGARDYVKQQFTPPPEIEALRALLHAQVAPKYQTVANPEHWAGRAVNAGLNLPLHAADVAIDQLAESQTPGQMALNLLGPEEKIAALLGHGAAGLAAAIPREAIPLARGAGSLAEGIRRGSGANHPQRQATADRVRALYDWAATFPREGNWKGLNDPRFLPSFNNDERMARQYLRNFAANTPQTPVPTSAREAAAAHAYHLLNPEDRLVKGQLEELRGQTWNLPGIKFANINRAWDDELLSGLKVEEMGNFMQNELGPLGSPMKRRAHPQNIRWEGHDVPLVGLPLDTHFMHGVGVSPGAKLEQQYKGLKEVMSPWERLTVPHSFPLQPLREGAGGLTKKDLYDRVSWGLADTLARHDPGVDMQQLYGRFWSGAQAHNLLEQGKKLKFDGGLLDIHEQVGLLEPGAMTDPRRIYQALKDYPTWGNLGWGPGY